MNFQLFHWHLEISTKCVLSCPRCPRTEQIGKYRVGEMPLELIQRFLKPGLLREHVKKVVFCGGQGDPIYHSDFFKLYNYIKECHPKIMIVTITNGSYRTKGWWENFAQVVTSEDEVIFSIDGYDEESNRNYRVNSDWKSIMEGIEIMVASPALIRWSTIVFSFNQKQLNQILDLAKQKGVDRFCLVFSSLFGQYIPNYIDSSLGYDPLEPDARFVSNFRRTSRSQYWLKPKDHPKIRAALMNHSFEEEYKSQFNKVFEGYREAHIIPICKTGFRGIYVDVDGILYPCSWMSHPFERVKSPLSEKTLCMEDSMWFKSRDQFDLKLRSLEEILADPLWKRLEEGWTDPKKSFIECEKKCLRATITQEKLKGYSSKKLSADLCVGRTNHI